MAKTSKIVQNQKRRELVARYAERRRALKAIIYNQQLPWAERMEAQQKLSSLPRDSSPTRLRNRCSLTGRTRGYLRKFDLCRIAFRDLALRGEIPGVTKASW